MDTLAFVDDPSASKAMLTLDEPGSPLKDAGDGVAAERMTSSGPSTGCGRF